MRIGSAVALLGAAALGVTAYLGWDVLRESTPFSGGEQCTATVEGRTVELEVEQAENAALITAIAVGRGMPARAATIALATAYQESELYNIDYGDRDSLGLFQQRPSQGWGSPEQVLDPVYATNAFYDELVDVDGYESLEVTVAAQRVQRSAFPDAYADHEADARVLASALTGNSRAAFTCELDGDAEEAADELTESGLVKRAEKVRREVVNVFGDQSLGGFAPGGVRDGHMEGSTHYDGRAVDIFFRPVTDANKTRGWAVAHYLVAMADRLDVQTVIFDDRIWKNGWRSGSGWRDYDPPSRSGDRAILEHRDHVHVDVFD
ncbi:hypothetical protein [Nocardioides deserti]|uniref:ARB-07466-like C-terminal domain-containing protein n=1 Tax=Nocardioides deserti TaxID=1588644 RepID=A0ABR6U7N8_9ACTN|nr:hypothetical protein [Nocardioides deserti]MBC2960449.1 hypothetical protein [Nocardioides deserti]GGO71353.1 hypothetical protein GCM10012276_12120 [Nocardioides deserti]